MRRKRLRHIPNGIIDILDGYQMITQFEYFDKNGTGIYEMNLLTRELRFNSSSIESNKIFDYIDEWFWREITSFSIDISKVPVAKIYMEVKPSKCIIEIINPDPCNNTSASNDKNRSMNIGYTGKIKIELLTDEYDYSKTGSCLINR